MIDAINELPASSAARQRLALRAPVKYGNVLIAGGKCLDASNYTETYLKEAIDIIGRLYRADRRHGASWPGSAAPEAGCSSWAWAAVPETAPTQ
jgi:hypothetical protein